MNHKHTKSSIILDILLVLIMIIFIFSVYTFIQVKIVKKTYTHFAGFITFFERSDSMKMEIHEGDLLIVKLDNSNLKVGDIVSYYSDKIVITHRITKIEGNLITTKGDNTYQSDNPIDRDMILGKVVGNIKFGEFAEVLSIRHTYIPFIITIILIITTIIVFKIDKRSKNEEKKN